MSPTTKAETRIKYNDTTNGRLRNLRHRMKHLCQSLTQLLHPMIELPHPVLPVWRLLSSLFALKKTVSCRPSPSLTALCRRRCNCAGWTPIRNWQRQEKLNRDNFFRELAGMKWTCATPDHCQDCRYRLECRQSSELAK